MANIFLARGQPVYLHWSIERRNASETKKKTGVSGRHGFARPERHRWRLFVVSVASYEKSKQPWGKTFPSGCSKAHTSSSKFACRRIQRNRILELRHEKSRVAFVTVCVITRKHSDNNFYYSYYRRKYISYYRKKLRGTSGKYHLQKLVRGFGEVWTCFDKISFEWKYSIVNLVFFLFVTIFIGSFYDEF